MPGLPLPDCVTWCKSLNLSELISVSKIELVNTGLLEDELTPCAMYQRRHSAQTHSRSSAVGGGGVTVDSVYLLDGT